jgi:hypothetical protein
MPDTDLNDIPQSTIDDFVTYRVNKIQINDLSNSSNSYSLIDMDKKVETLQEKCDLLEATQKTMQYDMTRTFLYNKRLLDEQKNLKTILNEYKTFYIDLHKTLAQSTSTMLILEQRLTQFEKTSYDGTLLWRITNVSEKINESLKSPTKSFYSPVFFTSHTGGYQLACKLYLNGDGQSFYNKFVSIYLVVLKGNFDALLAWPFKQRCTFTLVDKSDPLRKSFSDSFKPDTASAAFRRPISEMNVPAGLPAFLSLKVFNSDEMDFYKRDDSMFIRVCVDTNDLREL